MLSVIVSLGNHSGIYMYTEKTQFHLHMSSYEPIDTIQVFEDVDGQFASTSKENGQH